MAVVLHSRISLLTKEGETVMNDYSKYNTWFDYGHMMDFGPVLIILIIAIMSYLAFKNQSGQNSNDTSTLLI